MNYTKERIAAALDYAVLKPTASQDDVTKACQLAKQEGFASVCVRPCDVRLAYGLLFRGEKKVKVATVIGFPHGVNEPYVKAMEAAKASEDGADELDIVINYSRILEGDYNYIIQELNYIHRRLALKPTIKIILETCYLTPERIFGVSKLLTSQPFVSFVKTSTGFGSGGATCMAVEIMREAIEGSHLQIKASGGINTYQDACTFLDLGCTRLGSSKWKELLPC